MTYGAAIGTVLRLEGPSSRSAVVMHHASPLAAAFVALAFVVASPLRAQTLDSLPEGARLRVLRHAPLRPVIGTLVRADSVSLMVVTERRGARLTIPRSDLRRIDVSGGQRSTGEAFRRGAKVGAIIGAGIGLVATGIALHADYTSGCDCMIPGSAIVGTMSVLFTGATTIAGGLIGLAGREQWEYAWPPR